MGVELTFKKDFFAMSGAGNNNLTLVPCTIDGEDIDNVISCSVKQEMNSMAVMTLRVCITETFADNTATRLKK